MGGSGLPLLNRGQSLQPLFGPTLPAPGAQHSTQTGGEAKEEGRGRGGEGRYDCSTWASLPHDKNKVYDRFINCQERIRRVPMYYCNCYENTHYLHILIIYLVVYLYILITYVW